MSHVGYLPTLPSLLARPEAPFIHRDLSWLQFNERVLAEAQQDQNPLLERAKFLAITASNLDEFFMIRFASLGRAIAGSGKQNPELAERLTRIRGALLETVAHFGVRQGEALDAIASRLEQHDIFIVRSLKEGGRECLREEDDVFQVGRKIFEEQVLPKIPAPEGVTPTKLNLLENLQVAAVYRNDIWFRIPRTIPPVFGAQGEADSSKTYFFFLDDLLSTHLGPAFRLEGAPGFVRITRDGDFTVDLEEEDTESIPDVVRSGLGSREKGRPVRLQYNGEIQAPLLEAAMRTLKLVSGQLHPAPTTLCLHGLWAVVNSRSVNIQSNPALKYPILSTVVPRSLRRPEAIFEKLQGQDLLFHHPYDSFDGYVAWIQAACNDPHVERIEQTVYRMDALSPVIDALKRAAQKKKISVIIELRARFDELNNLTLADELRQAGVDVAFGFGHLKLHAKIALVERREGAELKRYTHLSTGNYNALTARQYTDLAILTSNPDIGSDARHFFDAVWKGHVPSSFKQIVPAPTRLHRRLLNHIERETQAAQEGKKARIVAKVNALVDTSVIEQLYKASQAGVQVDLIVRGACSLIPGVKGLSENIRVISVVDRFLEHSRIYYFENSKIIYLSSADWMPRNFFSRLEIAFPVLDPCVYEYLEKVVIPAYLSDTVKGRELTPQGTWRQRSARSRGQPQVRSQFLFEKLALEEYRGTPLEREFKGGAPAYTAHDETKNQIKRSH